MSDGTSGCHIGQAGVISNKPAGVRSDKRRMSGRVTGVRSDKRMSGRTNECQVGQADVRSGKRVSDQTSG